MNVERHLAGLCILLTLVLMYSFFLFIVHERIEGFPGSEIYIGMTRSQISAKYHTNVSPPKIAIAFAWSTITITSLLSACGLFYFSSKSKIFDFGVYVSWMITLTAIFTWTFTFDREEITISLIVVAIVCALCCVMLVKVCRRVVERQLDVKQQITGYERWWSETIVLVFAGMTTTWAFITLAATTAHVLCYKISFGFPNAHLVGVFSLETCGTISLFLPILAQIAWTVADIYVYPLYTERVRIVYPFLSVVMLGIFLLHYESANGVSRNNAICLLMSLSAFVTFLLRRFLQDKIGNLQSEKKKLL